MAVGQTSDLSVTVPNVGDEPASCVTIDLDGQTGHDLKDTSFDIGSMDVGTATTRTTTVTSDQSVRFAVTVTARAENGGNAVEVLSLTVEERQIGTGFVLEDYDADENERIGYFEVLSTIEDWRQGELGDFKVSKVIEYWRTQQSFSTRGGLDAPTTC